MNLTIIGQSLALLIFIGITYRFIWPKLLEVLDARRELSLRASEDAMKASQSLEDAKATADFLTKDAEARAKKMVERADREAALILESAREEAKTQKAQILEEGRLKLASERAELERQLRQETQGLVVDLASRLLSGASDKLDSAWMKAQIERLES